MWISKEKFGEKCEARAKQIVKQDLNHIFKEIDNFVDEKNRRIRFLEKYIQQIEELVLSTLQNKKKIAMLEIDLQHSKLENEKLVKELFVINHDAKSVENIKSMVKEYVDKM